MSCWLHKERGVLLDIECVNTDLFPPAADNEYISGAINQFSIKYNESLQVGSYNTMISSFYAFLTATICVI